MAKGSGRSTVYVKAEDIAEKRSSTPKNSEASSKVDDPFKVIDLTPESQNLLRYISQPIPAELAVGYNQDFLAHTSRTKPIISMPANENVCTISGARRR